MSQLAGLVAEVGVARRQIEDTALAAVQAERDRQRAPATVRVALAGDLLAVDDQPGPRGAGRLDRVRHDDREERVRLVRGGERVAEARDRVADAAALGVELAHARLELRGHVVEGLPEGGELVAAPHGHPLFQLALGDRARGGGELAQGADDRAAEGVGEDADGDHGHGREEQEAAAQVADGLVDVRLRAERDQGDRRLPRVLGGDQLCAERPKARLARGHEAGLLMGDGEISADLHRRDHVAVRDEGEEIAGVQGRARTEAICEAVVEREMDDDVPEQLAFVVGDPDRAGCVEPPRLAAGEVFAARRVEGGVGDLPRRPHERGAVRGRERLLHLRGTSERAGSPGRVLVELLLVLGHRHADRGREPRVGGVGLTALRDLAERHRRSHQRQQRKQHEVDDEPELEASHGEGD